MLIRMSNQEMASKEKIEWRQKQEKDDIDRRKKLEEERQKEVRPETFEFLKNYRWPGTKLLGFFADILFSRTNFSKTYRVDL